MNWEAIGAVGEVLGAAGVIFTLGYLAVQIRQNTRALESTAAQAVTSTSADIGFRVLENRELASAFAKAMGGSATLNHSERFQVAMAIRMMFRTMENQFYQNEQGFLVELWPGYRNTLLDFLRVPFVREWWPSQKDHFGPAFRTFVDKEFAAASEGRSVLVPDDPADHERTVR